MQLASDVRNDNCYFTRREVSPMLLESALLSYISQALTNYEKLKVRHERILLVAKIKPPSQNRL